jgi:ADP-ribose pyrophosphatase YjhB (NUDIX family)
MEDTNKRKKILEIGREIQAISQSGLSFCKDPYDIERYMHLKKLSTELISGCTSHEEEYIEKVFSIEKGYSTPKLDIRAAVFKDNKILLINERMSGCWTLPGGYIDVNETLSEASEREVLEETGYVVKARKVAGVFDHRLHGHKAHLYHFYKIYMICDLTGGHPSPNLESEKSEFFGIEDIMSLNIDKGRTVPQHILRMFDHAKTPTLPADFD